MAKFNVIQKQRRAKIQELKRAIHGDPSTGKLKLKPQPLSISGKRKRKLFKKWRRDQKDALQQGLITMQDVEMAVADGTSQDSSDKAPMKFQMKKGGKLKIKKIKAQRQEQKKFLEASSRCPSRCHGRMIFKIKHACFFPIKTTLQLWIRQ